MTDRRPLHALTVDVEEWFHILDAGPRPERWEHLPSRIDVGLARIFGLCERFGVHATFFVLGWVARRRPDVVAEIVRRGHEVGSHSFGHRVLRELGPDGFARDLDASLDAIARAGGNVRAYRAPGFSLTTQSSWAFGVLADRGIELDASLFLGPRAHGGWSLDRSGPFAVVLGDGRTVIEIPTVPLRVLGQALPFSGGGYLRLLPTALIDHGFACAERAGQPVCVYVHPRELDPDPPELPLPIARRFKYYVGLDTVAPKLEHLLARHRFGTVSAVAAAATLGAPLELR